MKSKRPTPLVFTAPGAPGPNDGASGAPHPAESKIDAGVGEPIAETFISGTLSATASASGSDSLDLHAFEIRSPDSIGAVAPTDDRFLRSTDEGAVLPLLNPTTATDETIAEPSALPVVLTASLVSVVWALTPIMFAWGYRRDVVPFANDFFALSVFALLAIGPAALVWIAAYVVHQGRRLAAETRRAQALANSLMQPAALAARGAGSVVEQVRQEIQNAASLAERARSELLSLREVLAAESQRLVEATQSSSRTAGLLTDGLSGERERMTQLAANLDRQATSVTDAITRQGRMVAEASDLAETQIREAEASLAARAADLAAAAGEAGDAARMAAEDLTRQVARLETAGLGVGDQARIVEDTLTQQRAALVAAAHGMRADQEVLAAEAESHMAQLREILVHARSGAGEINENALEAADGLRHVIAQAADQLRQISDTAAEERDLLSASAAQSLGAVSEIGAREREALERQVRQTIDALLVATDQASVAAGEQAQITREKIDQLGEAAFTAGQKADSVFETRLSEARHLIEQSAGLVDEAGARSHQRLAEGLSATQATLSQMENLIGDLDSRIDRMPADAQARAEAVRESIEKGMDDLMASARRAAEETQAIDAAFQDRVRRNYEMLSEAVRLMGVVAGAAGTVGSRPPPASPQPQPAPSPAATPSLPSTASPPSQPVARPEPPPVRPVAESSTEAGLRPRLRLTPTASDEEFKTVFDSAGGREAPETGGDSWTWKELLSSVDEGPGEAATPSDDALLNEIDAMGIDAGALLPRARLEEIAAALYHGDLEASRQIVRRLAPAAIRRLSRRMMTDRAFHTHADRFARRYQTMLADAGRERDGVVATALLGSDQGRAFLLIDAAAGDVA
ncbi:MAG TPA: polar localization protein TipN [Caulobacteraceae bacterium]|jgi:hypothetical protein